MKTAGFEAEYGQATGGVVNVITKSGSNNYRGTAFAYVRPEDVEGDYTPIVSESLSRSVAVNTTNTSLTDRIPTSGRSIESRARTRARYATRRSAISASSSRIAGGSATG